MIQKLRRQFILVIMSVVALLMIAAFLGVLISTSGNLQHENQFMLKAALERINRPENHGVMPGVRPVPMITVSTDHNGNVTEFSNQIFNFSDDDIGRIAERALEGGRTSGILKDYNLRYMLIIHADGAARLAFIDNAMETQVITNLLKNSAVIGASTLILFFVASVFLSRWVVKPVEKAWNSQRQFVADASHELKTPLTVILSSSALLADNGGAGGEKTKARLDNILAEAKHMKILVDDLLSLARSDDASGRRNFEKVHFSGILVSAALRFEPIIFDHGKTLEYDIADNLYVVGDGRRLQQLFEILLDNACRHSEAGSIISVRAKPLKSDVCLEVSNESETISKAELDKIFERFYRLDKSRSHGGYGLGLSIAASVVREHGGKIWAASDNGKTMFTVTLPAARPREL